LDRLDLEFIRISVCLFGTFNLCHLDTLL